MNIDGASDSKPMLEVSHEHTSFRQPEPKPTKLRRFVSISSRLRESRLSSKHHTNTSSGSTPPLQTLSPHPAEAETRSKTQAIRSISSLFLSRALTDATDPAQSRNSTRPVQCQLPVAESPSLPLPPTATKAGAVSLKCQELLPHTDKLYQFAQVKPRKDFAVKSLYDMPTAASRAAALTSHPVGEEDLGNDNEMQKPGVVWERQNTESGKEYA